MSLQQHDAQVTGTWTHVDDQAAVAHGEIAGTLSGFGADTRLTGTMTWNIETASGTGRCLGRTAIAGPVNASFQRWTAERLPFDNCTGAYTELVVTLGR